MYIIAVAFAGWDGVFLHGAFEGISFPRSFIQREVEILAVLLYLR